jgi:hypothetical protein
VGVFNGAGTCAGCGESVSAFFQQRSGRIDGLLTRYGQGKVMLLGPHLEAGRDWYRADGIMLKHGTAEVVFARLRDRL